MLNHARTLLVNLDPGDAQDFTFFAEEAIDADFRVLTLPSFIETFRQQLFGATPDRAMRNYRAAQFLALLHASPLDEYLRALDPRITYDIATLDLVENTAFTPVVSQATGAAATLSLIGQPAAPDANGRMYHVLRVDILTDSTVQVAEQIAPHTTRNVEFTMSNGLSSIVALPGTGYSFRMNTDNPGCTWLVEMYNRPQVDLGALAASLEHLGEPVFLDLFGVAPAEPYLTFRNLWADHKELPLKFGGLLMALIYRSEEVRLGGS